MKLGIVCQSCGIEAPCRHVEFHQNIGALIMRFHSKTTGDLCKRCIHHKFWAMTSITLAVGWLGVISLIVAPFFVLNNIIQYIGALRMPPVPPGARAPFVNEEILSRFLHMADEVFSRIQAGEDPADVARSVAPVIGITPGQVIKSMVTLVQHQQMQAKMRQQDVPIYREPSLSATVPPPIAAAQN